MKYAKYLPMYMVALVSVYNLALAQGLYGLGKWFWIYLVMGVALLAASVAGWWIIRAMSMEVERQYELGCQHLDSARAHGAERLRLEKVESELKYKNVVLDTALHVLFREWLSIRKVSSAEPPWALRRAFEVCCPEWLAAPEVLYQFAQPWNQKLVLWNWHHFASGDTYRMRVLEYVGRMNDHPRHSVWLQVLDEAGLDPYTTESLKEEAKYYGNVDLEL